MMCFKIKQLPVVAAIILQELAAGGIGCQCEGHNGHKQDGEHLSEGVHVGDVESNFLISIRLD